MNRAAIQVWLTYWDNGDVVNVGRILAYDQVHTARLYCSVMTKGVFADVTDGEIWDALREMRGQS